MRVQRETENPGESRISGRRPGAGRTSVLLWVRVAARTSAGIAPVRPRPSIIRRASSRVAYGAGRPPPDRAAG
ncbi:hypothetical protein GCM10010305_38150 [Streptomyces termitum]|uniref:Uncharacterized protein n=1 Tax=Streptomyces termitum TaxID=67368 RepID=A0A918T5K6_9ACTN|nr:hypothetical protein GCM10010305_38150 [Streptomyces termitum]